MSIQEITFKDFYTENKDHFKEFAFLFGNGLIKSYPKKDTAKYKKVQNSVILHQQDLNELWKRSNNQIQSAFNHLNLNSDKEIEAENFLNYIRRVYSFCVFEKYIEKQQELTTCTIQKPREFLKLFKSIYTLSHNLRQSRRLERTAQSGYLSG